MGLTFTEFAEINAKLDYIIGLLKPKYILKGGTFMYIVKDDNPDVGYTVDFIVTDAEGVEVPLTAVDVAVISDFPEVVEVIPDPEDVKKGMAHFGAPGNASLTCNVSLKDGTLIGSFGAQFTVTAGDPAAISGGKMVFEGLTEV